MKINGMLDCHTCDDGSVGVEIYGHDWRIGIVIDTDTDDSGMWLISRHEGENTKLLDLFPKEILDALVQINAREKPYEIDRWADDGGANG